jgi:hypothetical protein
MIRCLVFTDNKIKFFVPVSLVSAQGLYPLYKSRAAI